MIVQCIGSGDAFGSGGRMNTSYFVKTASKGILLDCGATTLVALKKAGLSSSDIDVIILSHLHGDHMGGVPFILTERRVMGNPDQPLTIVAPATAEHKMRLLTDCLFPGIYENINFPLTYIVYHTDETLDIFDFKLKTFKAIHAENTFPHSIRLEADNQVVAFSGDTEWNDNLIPLAEGADLFICEGYAYNAPENHHMDVKRLLKEEHRIKAKKIVLTHLSEEALENASAIPLELANDGEVLLKS